MLPPPARGLALAMAALLLGVPGVSPAQDYGGSGGHSVGSDAGGAQPEKKAKKQKRRSAWGRRSERNKDGEREWSPPRHEIDPRTGKRLIEARELLTAEQYDEANAALDKLRMRSLNPLERARVYQIRAFVAYGQEDSTAARDYLEQVLAEEVLSPDEAAEIRFQIAQIWLQDSEWSEAAKNLELWFTMVDSPNAAAYYILALTYYQMEQPEKALVPSQQAVDLTDKPRESWLQLLLALRLTRKDYAESIPILEQLVARFPKKSHWINLSTVYGALGNYEEALVPLQLAYTEHLLDQDPELRRLAQLLLFLELPYRAALVLETALETKQVKSDVAAWEMLSNSWIAAREYDRAVAPLETAGRIADAGDLYVRLAQVHIQREKWAEAAHALREALDKGGLRNPGDAQLLMGIAFYSQKRPEQARRWFARARKHDATRDEANTWIKYIDRELASG